MQLMILCYISDQIYAIEVEPYDTSAYLIQRICQQSHLTEVPLVKC